MRYAYSALRSDGRRVKGRMEAAHPLDLETLLKQRALYLVRCRPVTRLPLFGPRAAPRRECLHFCFQWQQLLRAGVPLLETLTELADSLEHPQLKEIATQLAQGIEGGQTLSQALTAHPECFDAVFISLIRAGERSGDLAAVLEKLGAQLKWEEEWRAQRQKLLLYPGFVATIMLAATSFLMLYLVPQLKLFVGNMGQTLPLHARLLFWLSDLLAAYWPVPLALLILGGVGSRLWLFYSPAAQYRLDALKLRLPVLGGILQKIILARFADTFAMLYAAGIPVLEALATTQDVVGNRVIRQALEKTGAAIREGRNMASAFQEAVLFPPLVVRMARVGETTGALDTAMKNVSYFYSRDAEAAIGRVEALIEPLLTLALGALMGWIVLSVIGPIYDIISQFKA
ncbi:MAG: type II secretion system F family protein [Zoogloeaceae bacterium]|jgi:type IV pilus assembly protein PilC|nr:type II secretion system F family protein [Zoogloeaceae bacterium]